MNSASSELLNARCAPAHCSDARRFDLAVVVSDLGWQIAAVGASGGGKQRARQNEPCRKRPAREAARSGRFLRHVLGGKGLSANGQGRSYLPAKQRATNPRNRRSAKSLDCDSRPLTPKTTEVDAERDRPRRGVARLCALFAWLTNAREARRRQTQSASRNARRMIRRKIRRDRVSKNRVLKSRAKRC